MGKYFIGIIEDDDFKVFNFKKTTLYHVLYSTRCTNDDVDTSLFQNADVFFDNSSTNTSVDLDALIFTNGVDDVSSLH